MSLDYILVKGTELVTSLDDLVEDESFALAEYRSLADALLPNASWDSDCSGQFIEDGVSVELNASDAGLSLYCRGNSDIIGLVHRIATQAYSHGVVMIDVQLSEIVAPEPSSGDPAYIQWYRDVLATAGDSTKK